MTKAWVRIFYLFNRKPAGKTSAYFSTIVPWMALGVLLILLLLFSVSLYSFGVPFIVGASVSMLAVALLALWCWHNDNKHGYTDAIHRAYLEHRQRAMDLLGKKDN